MKLVYISGPITQGNRNQHFFRSCETEKALMLAGFAPINPMRSMVLPFAWQPDVPHQLWLGVDKEIVGRCDLVVRLPGESAGADEEIDHAAECAVPVLFIDDTHADSPDAIVAAVRLAFSEEVAA